MTLEISIQAYIKVTSIAFLVHIGLVRRTEPSNKLPYQKSEASYLWQLAKIMYETVQLILWKNDGSVRKQNPLQFPSDLGDEWPVTLVVFIDSV